VRQGGLEWRGRLLALEVKATSRPTHRDVRHLSGFLDEYGKTCHGAVLLHTGTTVEWLAEGVLSAPWWRVL
jgi:hypothetical protein